MSKLETHPLHVRPNIDGRPIYPAVHVDSKAAVNGVFVDGFDVCLLIHENARLKDEIELLLHVGKEAED